ncbi:hypothetical protein GF324_03085, partial [bacterium]|nr:hypothetical protein [bacterium]
MQRLFRVGNRAARGRNRIMKQIRWIVLTGLFGLLPVLAKAQNWTQEILSNSISQAAVVTTADFNGDGLEDIAAAGWGYSISWWEQGAGLTWTSHQVDYLSQPSVLSAADLDGDNDMDLFGVGGTSTWYWWENVDGNGLSWTERGGYFLLDAAGLTAADLDGDDDLDIVGISTDNTVIRWWENDGTAGTFTLHSIPAGLSGMYGLAVEDLDGDSDLDIAVSGYGAVKWFENLDGNAGSWADMMITTNFYPDTYDGTIRIADLDNDGDMDIAGTSPQSARILWWENTNGSGDTWTEYTIQSGIYYPRKAELADVDNDSDIDLIAADLQGNIRWWENNGSGTSWSANLIASGFGLPWDLNVADIDSDGDVDLVGADYQGGRVAWWEQPGSYTPPMLEVAPQSIDWSWDEGGTAPTSAITITNTGQGVLNWSLDETIDWLSVTPESGSLTENQDVQVQLTAENFPSLGTYNETFQINAPDASPSSATVSVSLEATSATQPWTETLVASDVFGARSVFSVDFNMDGDFDILAAAGSAGDVMVWENNGSGTGWSAYTVSDNVPGVSSVAAVDMDQDGDQDILGSSQSAGRIVWWEYEGYGGTWTEHVVTDSYNQVLRVRVADIDRDGDLDVVAVGRDDYDVRWWENTDGSGTSWTEHSTGTYSNHNPRNVVIADLDGDEDFDFVYTSDVNNNAAWWENTDGTGTSFT